MISLQVSAYASGIALVIGVAIAWLLEKSKFRLKWLIEGVTLLALVFPPTVLGYYLLLLFGRQGLGLYLERIGLRIVFALPGAVLAATIAAIPLVVQLVRTSFAEVSQEIEDAGRVDGCSRSQLFWYIDLGIAWRGVVAGGMLGFLRAIGDFGTTLMVAGNIPGRTQTLSMALYDAVQSNDTARANELVLILSAIAFGVLFVAIVLSRSIYRTR
ncbi:molybdate ABC transporter permease subunit [Anaerolinea thermolimosa]|uniref:molybdate ABC transporter permease subunit n=1 Tax=Anaerolinea thermolimosa TaxID=229919 RepID=UPI0013B404D7|nr:molybdate ABC transporter permease subunit [Anaerolinea thermolimosa]